MRLTGNTLMVFIVAFFLALALFHGNNIYENDAENNIDRDIYNYTDSIMKVPQQFNTTFYNETETDDVVSLRISNIIYKQVDALTYSIMEFMKLGTEIGYNAQGKYNVGAFIFFVKGILILITIGVLFSPVVATGVIAHELYNLIKNKIKNGKHNGNKNTRVNQYPNN